MGTMHEAALNSLTQGIGYAACLLVLATFCFSNPVWLRSFALTSNVAFIAFGYMDAVYPVMLLHVILLPINAIHLARLAPPSRSASPGGPTPPLRSAGDIRPPAGHSNPRLAFPDVACRGYR
jgi:hypothetical protein